MIKGIPIMRLCIEMILAMAAGSAELVIWNWSDANPYYGRYLFIYPLILGFVLGSFGRSPIWTIGPATMVFYPVEMLIDLFKGGSGLNLWPISLLFCGLLVIISLVGAGVGRLLKGCVIKVACKKMKRPNKVPVDTSRKLADPQH